ncbi:hypothetical protein [Microbacterium sp. LWH12-1.2]|uniref:hypothetical protein n=1 Tax=Microbacterium sp. LWH12-1.2 TaxID=3135259 RepID=UPI003420659B
MNAIEEVSDYETAVTRMLMVTPPEFWELAQGEAKRREELMETIRRTTMSGPSSPRVAAAHSVYMDALCGRLW